MDVTNKINARSIGGKILRAKLHRAEVVDTYQGDDDEDLDITNDFLRLLRSKLVGRSDGRGAALVEAIDEHLGE